MKRSLLLIFAALVSISASVFAADALPADPDSPAAELASFKIADGFDVSLFSSESDGVVKPIQIRFDPRGRLWVIGSTVYPQLEPGQVPNDKVIVLEDTNADGKSDKATVFADGLMIPTGLEIDGDGKGCFVGHGTQLLHLRDTDDDGRADERTVLLRGFGTGDSHQNINSFLFGPGGELWMCQGLSTRSRVETPWGISVLNQAGLWRLYPRRLKLEGFYGTQFDPQNPWGYAFTDWGEPLVMSGNNSAPIYPVPGLVPDRKPAAPPTIWKAGKGRKLSGGDIVGTAHFPPAWQGTLFVGGYINNAVWSLKIADDGAGFSLDDKEPLIQSSSVNFRPVDVKFGPDGSLYICDWFNPIIGHYQASLRDPRRDKAHGRIWRVTAKARPLTPKPALADASVADIVDQLKSKDRWTRQFAKRVLSSRSTDEVTKALRAWVAKPGVSDLSLKEALGVFQSHEAVEASLVERLSKSQVRSARAYAANVIGSWADRLPDPLALLRPLADDADPRVRLQAVVACTYVQKPQAIEVAMIAADHDRDKFIDYAIEQAVYSLKPQWLAPFTAGELKFDGKTSRLIALVKADGTPDTVQAVRALVASPKLDALTRESFYRILASVGDAKDLAAILAIDDPVTKARLLPALAEAAQLRKLRPSGDLGHAVTALLSAPSNDLRAGGLALAAAWQLSGLRQQVEALAADAAQPPAVRVAAVGALPGVDGRSQESCRTLMTLAGEKNPLDIRMAAIVSLMPFDLANAAANAAKLLQVSVPDDIAAEVVRSFLSQEGGPAALVNAFDSNHQPAPDAAKVALRVMSATGRRDEALAAIFADRAGLKRGARKLSEAEMVAFVEQVKMSGNAKRGAEVFVRAESGCVACHAVAGKGGTVGPDLGAVGTAHPADFIVGAILEPNREVREGYIAHEIVTKAGESYQGYILGENAAEVTIRDVARNKEVKLRKDTIKTRVQRGSVMPPGLADLLTDTEFRDLVKYLTDLGRDAGTPSD